MSVTPTSGGFSFRCGVLVGLSPLVLLFFLACLVVLSNWSSVDDDFSGREASPPLLLPNIDPDTPLADLLPTPPEASKAPLYLGDDLALVPELKLEATPELSSSRWVKRKGRAVAAALLLNSKEEDGFLKALLRNRPDLAGLPFAM